MTVLVIVAILVVGIILLLAELAVLPGFGIAGGLGVLALIMGAVTAWVELSPAWGVATGVVALISSFALLYFFPKTSAGKKLVLKERQDESVSQPSQSALLGAMGVTVTPLRPTGRAKFGQDEVDVVSDSEYIDANKSVKVVAVEGVRVVVMENP